VFGQAISLSKGLVTWERVSKRFVWVSTSVDTNSESAVGVFWYSTKQLHRLCSERPNSLSCVWALLVSQRCTQMRYSYFSDTQSSSCVSAVKKREDQYGCEIAGKTFRKYPYSELENTFPLLGICLCRCETLPYFQLLYQIAYIVRLWSSRNDFIARLKGSRATWS